MHDTDNQSRKSPTSLVRTKIMNYVGVCVLQVNFVLKDVNPYLNSLWIV